MSSIACRIVWDDGSAANVKVIFLITNPCPSELSGMRGTHAIKHRSASPDDFDLWVLHPSRPAFTAEHAEIVMQPLHQAQISQYERWLQCFLQIKGVLTMDLSSSCPFCPKSCDLLTALRLHLPSCHFDHQGWSRKLRLNLGPSVLPKENLTWGRDLGVNKGAIYLKSAPNRACMFTAKRYLSLTALLYPQKLKCLKLVLFEYFPYFMHKFLIIPSQLPSSVPAYLLLISFVVHFPLSRYTAFSLQHCRFDYLCSNCVIFFHKPHNSLWFYSKVLDTLQLQKKSTSLATHVEF